MLSDKLPAMAEGTGIEWTDNTYNPWIGCTKVSPGCAHCYAEELAERLKLVDKWGPAGQRRVTKTAKDPETWDYRARRDGTRTTVFCASLADVFEEHPDLIPLRQRLWSLVNRTRALDWMILTKRAENIARMLPPDWGEGYPNVCLMVSVEGQKYFDERVSLLQAVPASFRALSVEPLIGALEMPPGSLQGIDLVIVGGESGPEARPMKPEWVRHAREACDREGVAFFFKQWGNWSPDRSFARYDLSNAVVFEDYGSKPRYLSELPSQAEREAVLSQPGIEAVFHCDQKHDTGSSLDGKTYKAHPFKGRAVEPSLRSAGTTSKLAETEQMGFGF